MSENQESVSDQTDENATAEEQLAAAEEAMEEAVEESLNDIDLLQQELAQATLKADEARDQLLRTVAEMENQKRRQATELEKARKFALEGFVKELVQVWDSLDLGVKAASEEGADVATLREGSELTLKLLADVMNKFGVEQIDPQQQSFDPEFHQAMSMVPHPDLPANTVMEVFQKGYSLNGRLVRPAMVVVSQEA